MKVLFCDTVHPLLGHLLLQAGYIPVDGSKWTYEETMQEMGDYTGMIIRSRFKIGSALLDRATNLKWIARFGAGMENIDTNYASTRQIACLHAAEGNRDAVAEHALGMLLCLFNNLLKADREVRQGIWQREANRGEELMGKTVGIIGFGQMGSAFAERLKGFGVNVLSYDKYLKNYTHNHQNVQECAMDELYATADVVSLHLPLTAETRNLVNEEWINRFSKNFYLINTSRGAVADTYALVRSLESGKIKGACLDVLEYEDTSFEQAKDLLLQENFRYLAGSNKVVLSPHIAGWSFQSNEKLARVLFKKITELTNQT